MTNESTKYGGSAGKQEGMSVNTEIESKYVRKHIKKSMIQKKFYKEDEELDNSFELVG